MFHLNGGKNNYQQIYKHDQYYLTINNTTLLIFHHKHSQNCQVKFPQQEQEIKQFFSWRGELCFLSFHETKPHIGSLGKPKNFSDNIWVIWLYPLEKPVLPDSISEDWLLYLQEDQLWFIYNLAREIHIRYNKSGKIRHIKFYGSRYLQIFPNNPRTEFSNHYFGLTVPGKPQYQEEHFLRNIVPISHILEYDESGKLIFCRDLLVFLTPSHRMKKITNYLNPLYISSPILLCGKKEIRQLVAEKCQQLLGQ